MKHNHTIAAIAAFFVVGFFTAGRCQTCNSYLLGLFYFITWVILWVILKRMRGL